MSINEFHAATEHQLERLHDSVAFFIRFFEPRSPLPPLFTVDAQSSSRDLLALLSVLSVAILELNQWPSSSLMGNLKSFP
jgi:hypothetical protein